MEQVQQNILSRHTVNTVVAICMDFRFYPHWDEALFRAFDIKEFDPVSLAGGAKNIALPGSPPRKEVMVEDIGLAVEKHHANTIILLTHQNCGKYAADGYTFTDFETERAFHHTELQKAAANIHAKFPSIKILPGFMYVNKENKVVIEPIE